MNRWEIGARQVGYLELTAGSLLTLSCPAALGAVGCGEEGRQRELRGKK